MRQPLEPNLFVAGDRGLHRYKDDPAPLKLRRHWCGDWQVDRHATDEEIAWFEKNGIPAKPGARQETLPAAIEPE